MVHRSLSEGIITSVTGNRGRARTLKITPSFWDKVKAKLAKTDSSFEVAKVDNQGGQSGHLAGSEVSILSKQVSNLSIEVSKVDTLSGQSGQLPRSNLDLIPKLNTNIKIQRLNQAAEKFGLKKRFDY